MNLPKLILLDRDGVINLNSSDETSSFYYILESSHLILKPNVEKSFAILRAHGIPVILVTKQRCVGKGLLAEDKLNDIHRYLQERIGFQFTDILVETTAPDKSALFSKIIDTHRDVTPNQMILIDDSPRECAKAAEFGIRPICTTDLFAAICGILEISP